MTNSEKAEIVLKSSVDPKTAMEISEISTALGIHHSKSKTPAKSLRESIMVSTVEKGNPMPLFKIIGENPKTFSLLKKPKINKKYKKYIEFIWILETLKKSLDKDNIIEVHRDTKPFNIVKITNSSIQYKTLNSKSDSVTSINIDKLYKMYITGKNNMGDHKRDKTYYDAILKHFQKVVSKSYLNNELDLTNKQNKECVKLTDRMNKLGMSEAIIINLYKFMFDIKYKSDLKNPDDLIDNILRKLNNVDSDVIFKFFMNQCNKYDSIKDVPYEIIYNHPLRPINNKCGKSEIAIAFMVDRYQPRLSNRYPDGYYIDTKETIEIKDYDKAENMRFGKHSISTSFKYYSTMQDFIHSLKSYKDNWKNLYKYNKRIKEIVDYFIKRDENKFGILYGVVGKTDHKKFDEITHILNGLKDKKIKFGDIAYSTFFSYVKNLDIMYNDLNDLKNRKPGGYDILLVLTSEEKLIDPKKKPGMVSQGTVRYSIDK